MSNENMVLFVGGSQDGTWHVLPGGVPYQEGETYVPVLMPYGERFVMAPYAWTLEMVIERLIAGYGLQ